ncbi:MAG: hypothetical protein GXX87_01885 [Euryarchaeota archaeon]|jgi:hypothetical protein|nr:hypothetical protein [Euryarchaeota archaeon]
MGRITAIMWKVLGRKTIFLDIGRTAKEMFGELADEEHREEYAGLLDRSEIQFMINGTTEYNTFFFEVPDDLTPEQIQMMADVTLGIVTGSEHPLIEVEDREQRFLIIFSNDDEPELIGIRKTPGMSAGAIYNPIAESLSSPGRLNARYQ